MSDAEYIFNFRRVDDFLDNINREGYFDTEDMENEKTVELTAIVKKNPGR